MKVILQKAVPKLGKKDDIVEVSQGYAQNQLFPNKLAILATPATIDALQKRQQHKIAEKNIQQNLLDRAITELNGKSVKMLVKATEQGSLFSKVDSKDIAQFLSGEQIEIDPKYIVIPDEGIKKVGTYTIMIKEGEYKASITINIEKK